MSESGYVCLISGKTLAACVCVCVHMCVCVCVRARVLTGLSLDSKIVQNEYMWNSNLAGISFTVAKSMFVCLFFRVCARAFQLACMSGSSSRKVAKYARLSTFMCEKERKRVPKGIPVLGEPSILHNAYTHTHRHTHVCVHSSVLGEYVDSNLRMHMHIQIYSSMPSVWIFDS